MAVQIHPLQHPHRLSYSPDLRRGLEDDAQAFDLLHVHGLFLYPQFAAWQTAKRHKLPYIVSIHGMLHPAFRQRGKLRKRVVDVLWQSKMLAGANALHVATATEKAFLSELSLDTPVAVVPNGFDSSELTSGASGSRFRDKRGISGNTPLIVCHGRIAKIKGLDTLIAALPIVKEKIPNATLIVVGPDDENLIPTLRSLAVQRDVSESVLFAGALSGSDLSDAIAAADVWALLSHSDSFGMAVVEAMALGRPVVASKNVNIAPDASKCGALLMVDTDAASAAHGLTDLLLSPKRRHTLGSRAAVYSEKFDWANVAKQYVRLYEQLMTGEFQSTAAVNTCELNHRSNLGLE